MPDQSKSVAASSPTESDRSPQARTGRRIHDSPPCRRLGGRPPAPPSQARPTALPLSPPPGPRRRSTARQQPQADPRGRPIAGQRGGRASGSSLSRTRRHRKGSLRRPTVRVRLQKLQGPGCSRPGPVEDFSAREAADAGGELADRARARTGLISLVVDCGVLQQG